MENAVLLVSLSLLFNIIIFFASPTNAISSYNGPCRTLNDCEDQLICIKGKCNDDPDFFYIGTNMCGGCGGECKPSGFLKCKGENKPLYKCSPPVTSSTKAILTLNDGEGGAPSECDEQYHDNSERVVALSTGSYNGESRCGKMIKITASNGRSTTAKVVDECDSMHGCKSEHAGLPPCDNNIVDGSDVV
ncbi:kiwellin-like [Hevea brasiliensis]|uniref:kiwellin-like n=1 Tax=Hevea brasiliensis TaxID=3981 RepID=UPI0025DAFEB0|nr:kiwellin-like [Hevea brasiliensis]